MPEYHKYLSLASYAAGYIVAIIGLIILVNSGLAEKNAIMSVIGFAIIIAGGGFAIFVGDHFKEEYNKSS